MPLPNSINTYLVGDVLVDAGARFDGKKILKQLEGRDLSAHALTHAHPDHQGASKLVCETRGVPFWVPANDVREGRGPARRSAPSSPRLGDRTGSSSRPWPGPGHTVDRPLNEGDEVAGFQRARHARPLQGATCPSGASPTAC